jgi:proteasome activator subunit 4
MIKLVTWSKTPEELWLDQWRNPLVIDLHPTNPDAFIGSLSRPLSETHEQ